jgi:hypothetical protein
MQDLNTAQAAAIAGGAALLAGGVAGIRHAYGPRIRRVSTIKATRETQEQTRLSEMGHRTRRTRRQHANGAHAGAQAPAPTPAPAPLPLAASAAPAPTPLRAIPALDVGTLEELLAGLFSLRGDLTALAAELDRLRDNEKLIGAA